MREELSEIIKMAKGLKEQSGELNGVRAEVYGNVASTIEGLLSKYGDRYDELVSDPRCDDAFNVVMAGIHAFNKQVFNVLSLEDLELVFTMAELTLSEELSNATANIATFCYLLGYDAAKMESMKVFVAEGEGE